MKTRVVKVNAEDCTSDILAIEHAAQIIKDGGLVAFPTETVYGLGADALNGSAVKKIYEAKGRPSDNPLIVHISSVNELDNIAADISEKAMKLIDAFWPGPLTIIFKKKDIIPFETSGGLDTVAVRLPINETARLLIQRAGTPIAAPSANSSGKPSPTRATHVEFDLDGKIDMIIDGGACELGLESTIIDMTTQTPCLLRPGTITRQEIELVIGEIEAAPVMASESAPKAPGMKYKHYSPLAKVFIVEGKLDDVVDKINQLMLKSNASKIGVLATEQTKGKYAGGTILVAGDRDAPETIGANLFKMLRKFDYLGVEEIYAEGFTEADIELAIMNRLKKAAGYNIIRAGEIK